jgi:hypothetical protein
LHRLIVAESARFPDLAHAVARAGGRQEAVTLIADLLIRHGRAAAPTPADAAFAAQQFLQMIVSLPQLRAIGLGAPMKPEELDAWVRNTMTMLLHGVGAVCDQWSAWPVVAVLGCTAGRRRIRRCHLEMAWQGLTRGFRGHRINMSVD